jgi:hypothetical protein
LRLCGLDEAQKYCAFSNEHAECRERPDPSTDRGAKTALAWGRKSARKGKCSDRAGIERRLHEHRDEQAQPQRRKEPEVEAEPEAETGEKERERSEVRL